MILKDDYGIICSCNECERVFELKDTNMTIERFEEQNGYCDKCFNEQEEIYRCRYCGKRCDNSCVCDKCYKEKGV